MQKENYGLWLERKLEELKLSGEKPKLLLQSCCAPCSSYVLEYLSGFFNITLFFYNPNISPKEEFLKRYEELKRLLSEMPLKSEVALQLGSYLPERFFSFAAERADEREGGERCFLCYEMRLRETARIATAQGFDYFSTTLSISPHKNAQKLNEIGKALSEEYGVNYLFSDFKKKNGYKRSCELSEQYDLYRQSFCGCVYSRLQAEKEGRL